MNHELRVLSGRLAVHTCNDCLVRKSLPRSNKVAHRLISTRLHISPIFNTFDSKSFLRS